VNYDVNLAAWMIAGGPGHTNPAETRTTSHLRALAAAAVSRPGLADRIVAAVSSRRSAVRLSRAGASVQLDAACCAA
jgi:hypothetical protein